MSHTSVTELVQIAENVARNKGIKKEEVLDAILAAYIESGKNKYGHNNIIGAEINKEENVIVLFRKRLVVQGDALDTTEISLVEAKEIDKAAVIGSEIKEYLPSIDINWQSARTSERVILQKIKEAEKRKEFEDFARLKGEIVYGIVKRVEFGNIIVEIMHGSDIKAECMLKKSDLIRKEEFRVKDRIRACVKEVVSNPNGNQVFLSRASNEFLAKLFAAEVPEIYENVIEIKAVARESGSRAKIAVFSRDTAVDPVGSCVGVRGSRVQAVINELGGEKIDIILWSSDPATMVINALAPTEVSKVIINNDKHKIEVVVSQDQLSIAIGRKGQNVRLAALLCGWNIDVMTEDQESKRRVEEFHSASKLFMDALDVEDVLANLLVSLGFSSLEDLTQLSIRDVESIEGFDENLIAELKERAKNYLNEHKAQEKRGVTIKVDRKLKKIPGITKEIIFSLARKNIIKLEDLADLSTDELLEIIPKKSLTAVQAGEMIIFARNNLN